MTDHHVDKKIKSKLPYSALFILGWLVIAVFSSLDKDNKFKGKLALQRGLPALVVMGVAMWSQYMMQHSKNHAMIGMGVFIASWLGFATAITYSTPKGELRDRKMKLAYSGAILIIISMMVLGENREFDSIKQKHVEGNVYNMGLPLFTAGWVITCVAISVC